MINELISRVFCTRNAAHLAHWNTKSYAQHMALGSFYDEIVDIVDKLVEAHMGAAGGTIGQITFPEMKPVKDIVACLIDDVEWIAENREEISSSISALENIVDELTDTYLSTIYKLKQLS